LPRLLGDAGGLWLGGEAAQGWLASRGLYLQMLARLGRRVRAFARSSATIYSPGDTADAPSQRELGASLDLEAALASWLRLGARGLLRVPLDLGEDGAGASPAGVLGLDLTGLY
jgi:hypothetical protein